MHLCGVKHGLGDWGQRVLRSGATSILQSPVGLLRALSGPVLFNICMDDLHEGIEAKANNVGLNKAVGPAVGSPQPHTALQALGRVAGNSTGKYLQVLLDIWIQWHLALDPEQHGLQEPGSGCCSALATGDATSQILGSVLGPAMQERH